MATTVSKEDAHIKGQQAGRRLSGNQQRELTRLQTEHPERVEAAEEEMKKAEQRRDEGVRRTAGSQHTPRGQRKGSKRN
jgi:hypothetical protein